MGASGTEIRQIWNIPDGHLALTISTDKPLDSHAVSALEGLIDAVETYVYTLSPGYRDGSLPELHEAGS